MSIPFEFIILLILFAVAGVVVFIVLIWGCCMLARIARDDQNTRIRPQPGFNEPHQIQVAVLPNYSSFETNQAISSQMYPPQPPPYSP